MNNKTILPAILAAIAAAATATAAPVSLNDWTETGRVGNNTLTPNGAAGFTELFGGAYTIPPPDGRIVYDSGANAALVTDVTLDDTVNTLEFSFTVGSITATGPGADNVFRVGFENDDAGSTFDATVHYQFGYGDPGDRLNALFAGASGSTNEFSTGTAFDANLNVAGATALDTGNTSNITVRLTYLGDTGGGLYYYRAEIVWDGVIHTSGTFTRNTKTWDKVYVNTNSADVNVLNDTYTVSNVQVNTASIDLGDVLYADDFNNPGNGNDVNMTKPTTVGGYYWVEVGNTSGSGTVGNRMRFYNQAAVDASAYVPYSLDGVENYTVTFTLEVNTLQVNGNFVVSPRIEGTTSDAAAAHWSFDTDANVSTTGQFADLYFNGVEVASNILELDTVGYTVSIAVAGNNATLKIFKGTSLIVSDTRSLGSLYNNSIPDYAVFGYNVTGASSTGMAAYMDDLSVVAVEVPVSDFDTWAGPSGYNLIGGPDDDDDGDGLTNREEYLFGLDPKSGASVSPISTPLDASAGTFSYTRRDPALTNASYSYQYSLTLADGSWQGVVPAVPDAVVPGPGADNQTVTVDLTGATPDVLANPRLFLRVVAQ